MIKTPCVSICILEEGDSDDSKDDYCIGCFRTVREIQNWNRYTDDERDQIMAKLPEREETLG